MRTARRRNQEHEVIHERKVIREQDMDANPEYDGKETFVTSSYKRKMEERERWAREEEEMTRREEEADAKMKEGRVGNMAMGNFMFGIVGRNLLMAKGGDDGMGGGDVDEELPDRHAAERNAGDPRNHGTSDHVGTDDPGDARREEDSDRRGGVRCGDDDIRVRERGSSTGTDRERMRLTPPPSSSSVHATAVIDAADEAMTAQKEDDEGGAKYEKIPRRKILAERARKIRDARERYFERRGGASDSGTATTAM